MLRSNWRRRLYRGMRGRADRRRRGRCSGGGGVWRLRSLSRHRRYSLLLLLLLKLIVPFSPQHRDMLQRKLLDGVDVVMHPRLRVEQIQSVVGK